MILPIL